MHNKSAKQWDFLLPSGPLHQTLMSDWERKLNLSETKSHLTHVITSILSKAEWNLLNKSGKCVWMTFLYVSDIEGRCVSLLGRLNNKGCQATFIAIHHIDIGYTLLFNHLCIDRWNAKNILIHIQRTFISKQYISLFQCNVLYDTALENSI